MSPFSLSLILFHGRHGKNILTAPSLLSPI
uniref:Uncharacterized protein n=1 Tax=Siphoviridae sp. ct0Go27 TaxID=2827761 RepID=A0A8S5RWB5_9CAUD|nr:MAG TPA: hypothetical protein [Siphoviridae sp. ct0Go27]